MGSAFNWRVLTVDWWNVPSFVEHEVILSAQVTIRSGDATPFSQRLEFSYWEGE